MGLEEVDVEDWNSNRKLVLGSLDRIEGAVNTLTGTVNNDLTSMKIEIATQRVKTTVIAAVVSGVGSAALAGLISFLVAKLNK
jgi:hypothetical protein